ncbi:MAG: Holliday junction branch migration protein RuvA [Bacteroidales bacterium]|nr:Holliday junction branch migration protein RuvA [Bacteroidales bacterium]
MYDYISGTVASLSPTHVVIDNGGVGYLIAISLQTYAALDGAERTKLYIHQSIREDAHLLFGFSTEREREAFQLLLSVSGVGAGTARLVLSSLTVDELQQAVATENVNVIKQVKGVGLKTAQRIVIDLRDKMLGMGGGSAQIFAPANNTTRQEALSALTMLGFARPAAEKTLDQVLKTEGDLSVEQLIKHALKRL